MVLGIPNLISSRPPMQMAWTVFGDMDTAIEHWIQATGAGPFFVWRHVPLAENIHYGVPRPFDHTSAIGNWGDVQVELMLQHCDNPSHIRDICPDGRSALTSIGWVVDDMAQEVSRLEALGYPVVLTGSVNSEIRETWLDTRSLFGCYTEIFEESALLRKAELRCREASISWKGERPIRDMMELIE